MSIQGEYLGAQAESGGSTTGKQEAEEEEEEAETKEKWEGGEEIYVFEPFRTHHKFNHALNVQRLSFQE